MSARRTRPVRLIVTVVAGGILASLIVWPQGFGVQRALLFSQLIAFRGVLTIALGIGTVLFAMIALLRKSRGTVAGIAIVLAAATVASGAISLARGATESAGSGDLTVVAWNTRGGAVPPATVARFVLAQDADVVSLPEMSEDAAREVADG